MLTKEEKEKIIEQYGLHKRDTGSALVQVALLTEDIKKVQKHLKNHPKDEHTKRGLLKKVIKRKKLLRYLREADPQNYEKLTKKLSL